MVSSHLLTAFVAGEGILLALGYATLLAIAAGRTLQRRRAAGPIALANAGLAAVLSGGTMTDAQQAALRQLPITVRMRLVADLATNVGGDGRGRLTAVAHDAGIVAEAERLCASRRAVRRLRGLRVLTGVGAHSAAAGALMDDPDPNVRAAAATWALDHREPQLGAALVRMLDDERPLCRFAAKDALVRIGADAVAPLAGRLLDPRGRVEEALEVAAGLADPALLPAARAAAVAELPRRRVLAAEAVTAIGGPQAVAELERLLDDPDPDVRAAAATGLGHLRHWPAAPALAAALADPSWDVRRAAGLALRGLGGPGALLLQEALDNDDRFARDMARQVLGLPRVAAEARAA